MSDAALICVAVMAYIIVVVGIGDANVELQAFDYRALFSYQLEYYRESLLDGRLPLWNSHTFSGWPFMANPQSRVFYPTTLLYVWLEQPSALIVELALHLALAGLGTYALARGSFGTSRGAAILAAIVFGLSGAIFARVLFGHRLLILAVAYVPLLAFVIDRAVSRAGPWPWIGGILLALQILTGGLPIVWLGLIFTGLWRLATILFSDPLDRDVWLREGSVLAIIAVLGLLLAALQLLPSYELAQLSNRPDHDFDYVSYGSYDPQFLGTLIRRIDVAANPAWWWGHYSYLGVLPVALAIAALFFGWRDRRVLAIAVTGLFMALYMLGDNGFLLYPLFEYIPTFDLFRHPSRALFIVHLTIAVLAAIGVDKFRHRLGAAFRKKSTLVVLIATVICLLSWIDIVTAARWYRDNAFVPDAWVDDNPAHKQHADILSRDSSWYRFWFNRGLFRQNHAFASDAHSIDGYDVMMLDRYERFIHFMTDTPIDKRQLTHITPLIFTTAPSPFPFKILGIKYADVPGRILTRTDKAAVARAWIVAEARLAADETAALGHLRGNAFRPHSEVVIEEADAGRIDVPTIADTGGIPPAVNVTVTELTPENLLLEVGPHPAGFLVLSEIYYPGWRASVDSIESPVVRCNFILRCVQLDASDEPVRITLEFRSDALRWGAIISGLTALFVLSGLWRSRRH